MSYSSAESSPNVTVLGGGGGASTIAGGLATYLPEANLSIVVCMSDDGGSTGELGRQFGTMPVGDIRRNIGAVVTSADVTTALNYRFGSGDGPDQLQELSETLLSTLRRDTTTYDERRIGNDLAAATDVGRTVEGGLGGHTFGNLLLTGLAVRDGFAAAVTEVSQIVAAKAQIIPVTTTPHTLMMYDGQEIVRGEHAIDVRTVTKPNNAYVWLEASPNLDVVTANPDAIMAVSQADLAIIAPGSPYTSIAPVLAVHGISEALHMQQRRGGQLLGITNLENQTHDTKDWCVGRYAQFIQHYISGRVIDAMLYNDAPYSLPDPSRAVAYDPQLIDRLKLATIPANLVGAAAIKNKNDTIKRADIHHDPLAVARVVRTNTTRHSGKHVAVLA